MGINFTRDNAKEMSARGLAARLANRAARLENKPLSAYSRKRLARVRAQLDLVDAELALGPGEDSKRYRDLVDAATRLAEQERVLDDRPLPGSRRPAPEPRVKRQAGASLPFAEVPPAVSPANPATPPTEPPPVP